MRPNRPISAQISHGGGCWGWPRSDTKGFLAGHEPRGWLPPGWERRGRLHGCSGALGEGFPGWPGASGYGFPWMEAVEGSPWLAGSLGGRLSWIAMSLGGCRPARSLRQWLPPGWEAAKGQNIARSWPRNSLNSLNLVLFWQLQQPEEPKQLEPLGQLEQLEHARQPGELDPAGRACTQQLGQLEQLQKLALPEQIEQLQQFEQLEGKSTRLQCKIQPYTLMPIVAAADDNKRKHT